MIDGYYPFAMAEVLQEHREAAAALLCLAGVTVDEAQLRFPGTTGETFFFAQESVVAIEDPDVAVEQGATVARADLTEDEFLVVHDDGSESPLEVTSEGLEGPALGKFNKAIHAVSTGAVAGRRTIKALKWREDPENPDDPPVMLDVTVSYTSAGDGTMPVATAHLRFAREYDLDGHQLTQTHCIEHDPTTDSLRAGSGTESLKFVADLDTMDDVAQTVDGTMVPDPFVAETAQTQQARFRPRLPVDRDLTTAEWTNLIEQPLNPADSLLPGRA